MIFISIFFIQHSKAQCPYNNVLWTDLTPPACPGSNSTSCMFGGEYVTVNVVFGNIYTFTTCGDPDFDTQITLWTVGGGTLLSYNDDDCGLQSTITWTATFTGTVHVLLDAYDCVNQSICMTLDVSCTGGGGGPVVASDCADAVDVCTNLNFTIDPNGYGSIDEIPCLGCVGPTGVIGNPDNNNPGGSGNWGCLRVGELNPVHTYGDTGTYYVLLTVENANGCVDTAGHFVEITSEYILFVPSAFSPNKDGDNDYFFPKGIGIDNEEFEINIYDRWGNLIYEYAGRYDQWPGWDGRANGGKDIAQQDVYVWLIRVKDLNDEDHEHIGHVTLLR